jgi:hypothetical protein
MAEGKMLFLQAQDTRYSLYQKERLFRLASERFKAGSSLVPQIFEFDIVTYKLSAIAANTNNPQILKAWGVSLAQESELDDTKKAITKLKVSRSIAFLKLLRKQTRKWNCVVNCWILVREEK